MKPTKEDIEYFFSNVLGVNLNSDQKEMFKILTEDAMKREPFRKEYSKSRYSEYMKEAFDTLRGKK